MLGYSKCLILSLLLACGFSAAAPRQARAEAAFSTGDVSQWADREFISAMKARKTDAAVVAVVQDGRTIFSKGYGWSDRRRRVPIDPARSRIRIASVSKVFVATAIAQLVEKGAIRSLSDPANLYLTRIQLPANNGKPITIRHLITHTAGFEDSMFGTATRHRVQSPLPAIEIERRIPGYARPAGGYIDYSNAGFGILATLVEDVTSERFDQYLERRIFAPLGMTSTDLDLGIAPPSGLVESRLLLADGGIKPIPWVALHPFSAPAGAIVSTAVDMAKFIEAAARSASDADSVLLKAGAQAAMFNRQASSHPAMIGVGTGYFTYEWNGVRVVEHGGDLPGAHTMLLLLPELRTGLFISMANEAASSPSSDGSRTRPKDFSPRQISYRFLERFLGPRHLKLTEAAPRKLPPEELVGDYVFERRPHRSIRPLDAVLTVSAGAGGKLELAGITPLTPLVPGVYKGAPRAVFNYVAFSQDGTGNRVMIPYFPFSYLTRVSGFSNPSVIVKWAMVGGLILLSGLAALRWPALSRSQRWSKRLPLATLTLLLLTAVIALAPLRAGASLLEAYAYGEVAGAMILVGLANAVLVLAVLISIVTALAWSRRYWGDGRRGLLRRLHFSVLAVSTWAVVPPLSYMNLIGWPF